MLLIHCTVLSARQADTVWIRGVTGEALADNITPRQARERALSGAYAEALRRVGIQIDAVQFMHQSENLGSGSQERHANDAFVNVVRTSSQGFVTGRQNESWEVENLEQRPGMPPLHRYRVRLDVKVAVPPGRKDPAFTVRIGMNQHSYRTGEGVRLDIEVSKDCHLFVFNIAEDSVRLLYPMEGMTSEQLRAHQSFTFPPPGIRWTAVVPQGWESSQELLMVVATKADFDLDIGHVIAPGIGYVRTRHAALMELMRWLAMIPQDQVACSMESMEITEPSSR